MNAKKIHQETDNDNLTSENNECERAGSKIFNEVRKESDRKEDQNESVIRREKSSKSTSVKRSHKPKMSKSSSRKDDTSDG